jgi:hypothetical protein
MSLATKLNRDHTFPSEAKARRKIALQEPINLPKALRSASVQVKDIASTYLGPPRKKLVRRANIRTWKGKPIAKHQMPVGTQQAWRQLVSFPA